MFLLDGQVYLCGMAVSLGAQILGYSCLGHSDTQKQTTPKLITALQGKKAVQISAGSRHSLVLLESGAVMSFGDHGCGKLGHGVNQHQVTPKLIEATRHKKVVQVSAGLSHSLLLTESAEVLAFGSGDYNQNGHGDQAYHYLPKEIAALHGTRVLEVAAGVQTTLLTEAGEVVVFCEPEVPVSDEYWFAHGDRTVGLFGA